MGDFEVTNTLGIDQETAAAKQRCHDASQLIEAGDYEGARQALGEFWTEDGRARANLSAFDQGCVLIRVGAITGWLGSAKQESGAQARAKDLLSQGLRVFQTLGDGERQAEAQIDLAICYWREGAFGEASVFLEEAERSLAGIDSYQQLRLVLQRSLISQQTAHPYEAVSELQKAAHLFEACPAHAVKGRFHSQLGLGLRQIWSAGGGDDYLDKAILEYTASSYYFEQANNLRFEAAVENNLGFLCMKAGRHIEAHVHLERARRLFSTLRDFVHAARVDDTIARLYIEQGRSEDGLKPAKAAVAALEKTDERAVLGESLTTLGVVLARLKYFVEARATLDQAVSVTEEAGAFEWAGLACVTLIEELSDHMAPGEMITTYRRADAFLEKHKGPEIASRLRRSARLVMQLLPHLEATFDAQAGVEGNLIEQSRNFAARFEAIMIRRALSKSKGGVTEAARQLGISHQALVYKLNRQDEELNASRKPPRTRRRSIIKK